METEEKKEILSMVSSNNMYSLNCEIEKGNKENNFQDSKLLVAVILCLHVNRYPSYSVL